MKYCLSPREILYTLTRVTIQSFSITSTSQYFDKRISISCDINMMVVNWGEMHPQKVVGFQPLPHTWPPEYDIFYTKISTL